MRVLVGLSAMRSETNPLDSVVAALPYVPLDSDLDVRQRIDPLPCSRWPTRVEAGTRRDPTSPLVDPAHPTPPQFCPHIALPRVAAARRSRPMATLGIPRAAWWQKRSLSSLCTKRYYTHCALGHNEARGSGRVTQFCVGGHGRPTMGRDVAPRAPP